MPNQELFGLVGLLLFRTQEDLNKAMNVLYSNPVRSIESLAALLKVKAVPSITSEQLDAAKLSASTCLNYMLKVGVKEVDGVQQLGTFWDVLFDWRIDMVHKLNLEDTFQYLYRFWYAKHEKIFEQGMAKVTKALSSSSNNDCQLRTSVKLAAQNCEFFLSIDGHSSISNVIESLLLVGRCCMSALICEKVYYEGFKTVMEIMAGLFRAIKKWKTEPRVEMAKIETINWMIDCLEEADLDERNRRALIEEVYKRGKMSDMIMETYQKGGKIHQGMEKGTCWLCVGGNLQQRSNLMREKEAIAKIHLRFVMNGKNFYERIHTYLEKEEQFQPSFTSSLYCFASSNCTDSTADSFVSSLLELYIAHLKHYPQALSNCYQISFSHVVLPLMDLEHSKQEKLESDPLFLLNWLDNLRSGNTLDIPMVKAAALLRYIVSKYQTFYEKIAHNIIKLFESQEFDEQFWEMKRPSLECCLLILITLSQNLKNDQFSLQKLLQVFSKGIEIMLSNFLLCLVVFLLKAITRDADIPMVSERFLDFAKEGLQRNTHIRQFMMELYIEDQGERFSWPFLQSAFKALFLQRDDGTNTVYYQEIIQGSIRHHNKVMSNQDILELLTCSIDFCLQNISKNSCKTNKNMVLFTLRLMICVFDACHPQIMLQLNAQMTSLLVFLQRQENLQFQEQILQLTHAFFGIQQTFMSDHVFLTQNCIKAYKESGNYELCLAIFSRIITIASEFSIPIMLIFEQLSSIAKQMQSIDEKQEKKLYQELLVIEYCIQSKGKSIGLEKVSSLISQLLLLLEKSASPITRCRTVNIMLAARLYLKMEPINWPFMIKVVESFRMPYDQQFLAVKKLEMFVEDLSSNKQIEEYANILRFLDKILRVTNRKAKTIEPVCDCSRFLHFQREEEAIDQKAKKIILNILQKKRFTIRLIEERLCNDQINFLRGIQLHAEEESTEEEGVKAISFLCS